jgi:hypothetical protein
MASDLKGKFECYQFTKGKLCCYTLVATYQINSNVLTTSSV